MNSEEVSRNGEPFIKLSSGNTQTIKEFPDRVVYFISQLPEN